MARPTLGDRVFAQRWADLFLLGRRRVQACRQAARLENVDQVLDFLGLEPLAASLDDARIADLGIDRRGRHHQVIQQDRQLILERVSFLGKVLAGELAELPGTLAVELESDGRLQPLISRGVGAREVTAGHVLPVQATEDIELRVAR